MKTLQAATKNIAEMTRKQADLGTIEPGKLADIIVVKSNPLVNIFALDDPLMVMKGGVMYKGAETSAKRPPSSSSK